MGRKTDVAIAPASGIGGTTAQSFQYNGLAQTTFARDTASGNNADVTLVYDSIQRTVEEAQAYGGNSRYVTNDAFTSLPVSQFTFPNARQINSSYDALYRRQQIIEAATSAVIASWQFFGPQRTAEVALGNGIIQTMLNNARTHSAVQFGTVPNPAWGTPSSDRLGYDGSGRMIAKRYLFGGINSSTFAYNNTTSVVGNTTAFDPADNKFYERALHAESRSFLYQPVDNNGNIASPIPGYDSINRLLQYKRGTLNSTGGYQNAGGGSVATPTTLPSVNAQEAWNLDGMGNWRSLTYTPMGDTPSVQQRNHNRLNQITNFGGRPFTYDGSPGASNGNLADDSFRTYQFDAMNRQIQVNMAGGATVLGSYVFDAFNRRIRKTISNGGFGGGIANGTTDCIYLGNQVMEERNPFGGTGSTDTPIRQYIWGTYPGAAARTGASAPTGFRPQIWRFGGLNIDECIQLTTLATLGGGNLAPGTYYLLQDLLYRAVALTNSSGNIVEAYDTDAYGQTIIYTGPGPDGVWFTDDDVGSGFTYGANDMIFCGYRYDPETRLYHVRNRMFLTDAEGISVGRWLQRDPIGYAGGVNVYEYVGGRAVAEVDTSGNNGAVAGPLELRTPPWLVPYQQTCERATSRYARKCQSQSAVCSCPNKPWSCCAADVSRFLCTEVQRLSPPPGWLPLPPVPVVHPFGIPTQACFVGCANRCLSHHWSLGNTPAWQVADGTCRKKGLCSPECCYQSVMAEQLGLSQCAIRCTAGCLFVTGDEGGWLLRLLLGLNARINYGFQKCCGAK